MAIFTRMAQEALEPKAVLFADFAKDEYLPWSELNHSAKHFTHQKSIVGSQLMPFFKGHHLHEITPRLFEEYVSRRRRQIVNRKGERRRVREATANRDIACLKVMFRLAVEWGTDGIRVNCIAPGALTPAMERAYGENPVLHERLLERTPLGRIGDPLDDVGPVAVFLASEMARFITGQTLCVDGGGFLGL